MNIRKLISTILILNVLQKCLFALSCDKFCKTCNHLGECIECSPNTIFNSDLNIC